MLEQEFKLRSTAGEQPVMENPLQEAFLLERTPEPCSVVIFGASGDLTKRKLIPALYDLAAERRLPSGFTVVGCARSPMDHDAFREKMREATARYARSVPLDPTVWDSFARGLFYAPADLDDPASYERLAHELRQIARQRNRGNNWMLYMTTPPAVSIRILQGLWSAGLAAGRSPAVDSGWTRLILEKPFGHNLLEARQLNQALGQLFLEEQIYRIDHYLGKEAVQNILVFRFANRIFEPVWNNRDVDHVQITVAETVGVENRGSYYECAGALKDMVQNHLLQLMSLVAMEPPHEFVADAVRDEKVKVLHAIRPIKPHQVPEIGVRAHYGRGWIEGAAVPAYRDEAGVCGTSTTETYAAIKLVVDNWRWAGVPFYLRSGKRLAKRVSEIAVQFKRVPHMLFGLTPADQVEPNMLVMRIQPDEGITLRFEAKLPGSAVRLRTLNMEFQYGRAFGSSSPEAYERLLLDCMVGDSTLFSRRDAVDASWEAIMPIVSYWADHPPGGLPSYEAGSWGPPEADALIERDGRRWRRL